MPHSSTSTTIAPSCTSTPSFSSAFLVFSPSVLPNGGSTCGAASSSTTRARRVLIRRKSWRSVRCASSTIWPAISTPVGPAPTTTKVSSRSISSSLSEISASSKAPKIRPRSSSASSMLFMPGANSANWSLPKYDCPAPAATISESYGVTTVRFSTLEVTVRAARSMSLTWPRITRAFFWPESTSRVGGAISPSDRMPVATW